MYTHKGDEANRQIELETKANEIRSMTMSHVYKKLVEDHENMGE